MTLWDELYFEMTLRGPKSELKKFVNFLKSGELDEFFEISSDYIMYDDNYSAAGDSDDSQIVFTNDDCPIEIEEFDTDEFLEVFCKAATNLEVYGSLFDSDDDEFHFISSTGDSYYINSRKAVRFNDELDDVAFNEELGNDDEEYFS